MRTMNLQLRLTRAKYPFFAFAPQGKIKEKKIPREGREELDGVQNVYSLKKSI